MIGSFFLIRIFSIILFLILFLFNMKHTFYNTYLLVCCYFSVGQVQIFVTPWTVACQAPLSSTLSWSLLKFMSMESGMPSNHLIFCCSPFSFCLQSYPASRSFSVSQLFTSGGQNIRVSTSALVLPMNIQGLFPLGLTGLTSLQSKGLSKFFSSTTLKALI